MYNSENNGKAQDKTISAEDQAVIDSLVDPNSPEATAPRFNFDEDLTRHIVTRLLTSPEALEKFHESIRPSHFRPNEQHQLFYAVARDHYRQYKTVPTKEIYKNEVRQRLLLKHANSEKAVFDTLKLLYEATLEACLYPSEVDVVNNLEAAYIDQACTEFVAQVTFRTKANAVLEAMRQGKDWRRQLAGIDAAPPGPQPTGNEIRCFKRSELRNRPKPVWLVEGLIPQRSLGLIYGSYATCKTFFALETAACCANGLPIVDKFATAPERPLRVVYVAAEGDSGMQKRLDAWELARIGGKLTPDERFALIPDSFSMLDEGNVQQAIEAILRVFPDGKIDLIVLDTLARLFGPGDESLTRDMNAFVLAASKIQRTLDTAVAIVHHPGKDLGRGPRGAVSLPGAVDWAIEVSGGPGEVKIRCEKLKDFAAFDTFYLTTESITLPDGDDSLVLRWSGLTSLNVDTNKPRINRADKALLAILKALPDTSAEAIPLAAVMAKAGKPKTTTHRYLNQGIDNLLISRSGSAEFFYHLTDKGKLERDKHAAVLLVE